MAFFERMLTVHGQIEFVSPSDTPTSKFDSSLVLKAFETTICTTFNAAHLSPPLVSWCKSIEARPTHTDISCLLGFVVVTSTGQAPTRHNKPVGSTALDNRGGKGGKR